jgi:hypothetical protein
MLGMSFHRRNASDRWTILTRRTSCGVQILPSGEVELARSENHSRTRLCRRVLDVAHAHWQTTWHPIPLCGMTFQTCYTVNKNTFRMFVTPEWQGDIPYPCGLVQPSLLHRSRYAECLTGWSHVTILLKCCQNLARITTSNRKENCKLETSDIIQKRKFCQDIVRAKLILRDKSRIISNNQSEWTRILLHPTCRCA